MIGSKNIKEFKKEIRKSKEPPPEERGTELGACANLYI
jgi:hypothetical protein